MDVRHISFEDIKAYWIEVDHFRDPAKRIREVVARLGPMKSPLSDPRRRSYGLFDGDTLIGATHLVQWDDHWIRYRTLNVRTAHRGQGLGWTLLRRAVEMDWRDSGLDATDVLGWIRRDHEPWARRHGFEPVDGQWHDDHLAMTKPLDAF